LVNVSKNFCTLRERLQWKSFFSVAELDEATEKKIVTESAVFFRLLAKVLAKKTRPKIILP